MSKLDFDLLQSVDSFIDPIKQRVLDMRGLKIQMIENLILTKDANDTIDFTDNDILKLAGFSFMPNLKTLLMANNRIVKIEENLSKYVPNLQVLILTNNAITELGDLDPLLGLLNLKILSLVDNIVANKQYYRLYVIHKCPSIRILDFRRVTEVERKRSRELFNNEQGLVLLQELSKKAVVNDDEILKKKATPYQQPSSLEQKRIRDAIKNAKTLQEIAMLEQQLAGGIVHF
jgi:U2 small nuclear ribonucleoprotein A'